MEMAMISEGHVKILGHVSGRSRLPLTIASTMEGWSEPTLTKQAVIPALMEW
jgi:hypothetical protein